MPKKSFEDMIKIKTVNRSKASSPALRKKTETNFLEHHNSVDMIKEKKSGPRYALWFVASVSILFFLFALSFLFSEATITVNSKNKIVTLNENLSASKDASGNVLQFDLVVITGSENKNVQGGNVTNVEEKAKGRAIVYNAYSDKPQTLSINTKLEGSNGKIYKTLVKTIVPGMNKNGTPGSMEVAIYGETAGEEYNSVPIDFKIFGFKGTPKYTKFYARSKGSIAGGFKGEKVIVSDADKKATVDELIDSLKTKLIKKATDQIPSGLVLFKDAAFLSIDEETSTPVVGKDKISNIAKIGIKGTLYGFIFDEKKLTKKIAENEIEKYDDSPVRILKIRDLTFSFNNKENISFKDVKDISFNLSGESKIVWDIDINKLTTSLFGKSKKEFNQILTQYPNIESANLSLFPAWKMSIPDRTKDIKVIVND